ncbi:MAG: 3-isopropylmalate dehydratase large subunit [Proteobacteria bacterium]|nr:3-isopropylmalate dehydratase large subunit [Pseudomonadota bacterium]
MNTSPTSLPATLRQPPLETKVPRTLLDKIWEQSVVVPESEQHPAVVFVDLHILHEVTSGQAFKSLADRGLKVRHPERTVALADHAVPTGSPDASGNWPFANASTRKSVELLEHNCRTHGIECFSLNDDRQGIVHVVVPELGLTWPSSVIVCGDSHTSTQGAYGALAFGIGSSEVAAVLATQTLLMKKPVALRVELRGEFKPQAVTAKDISLAVLAEIGVGGAQGGVIEFTGPALRLLGMDERMTLCNQSVEAGARTALIAPDEITFADLAGRKACPQGEEFERLKNLWAGLKSDENAEYARTWIVDIEKMTPRATYGTLPALSAALDESIPDSAPAGCDDAVWRNGLDYMAMHAGMRMHGIPVQHVFIGSCTNGRLSDLRLAAEVLRGKKIAPSLKLWVVAGSRSVKRAAEAEGLDRIFRDAGADWREPSCSLCVAMNGDFIPAGETCVSTSNRNFAHRQGPSGRTILASPLTAAATALKGCLTDPREVL